MSSRASTVHLDIPGPDMPVLKDALELYICMQDLWLKLRLTSDAERLLATDRRVAAQSMLIDIEEL